MIISRTQSKQRGYNDTQRQEERQDELTRLVLHGHPAFTPSYCARIHTHTRADARSPRHPGKLPGNSNSVVEESLSRSRYEKVSVERSPSKEARNK